ncbi:MAG: outer membrane beta-barrel protein [Blastocatellia bacterium]
MVKQSVFFVVLMAMFSTIASAQDAPKAELYGGYSAVFTQDFTLHGWQASIAGNLNNWFGMAAEFGGAYDSDTVFLGGSNIRRKSTLYSYLFGPRFSRRGGGRMTPFVHALFGGVHAKAEVQGGVVNGDATQNGFGMALGGGLDVKLTETVALRVIQADYFLTRSQGDSVSNGRVSAGVVIRFK